MQGVAECCGRTTRALQQVEELFSGQFNIVEDAAKQSGRDVFASMDRHDSGPSIRMTKVEMTAFLTDALESESFEEADQLARFEDRELAYAGTLICWTPMKRSGWARVPSTSRQSSMASRTRLSSSGMEWA